jgi:hypothetical protein
MSIRPECLRALDYRGALLDRSPNHVSPAVTIRLFLNRWVEPAPKIPVRRIWAAGS